MNNVATVSSGATENSISGLLEQIRHRHHQLVATAFPESLQPADCDYLRDLRSYFREQGILPEIGEEIIEQIRHSSPSSMAEALECVEQIISRQWRGPSVQSPEGTHFFIGPPGSGKTTVLLKWLAQAVLLEEKTARVLRLDSNTANTAESLSVYAEALGVSVLRSPSGEALLSAVDLTLVDLPGVDSEDPGAIQELIKLCCTFSKPKVHLVLNAAYETIHLLGQIQAFSAVNPSDLVFTHLDEEKRWGKLINCLWKAELPLRWLGVGQNVPGGLVEATPRRLVSQPLR